MGRVIKCVVSGLVGALLVAGCAVSKRPVAAVPSFESTADMARRATVLIEAELGDEAWTGTGWYVYTNGAVSLVVTAGHACEPGATYKLHELGDVVFEAVGVVDSDETTDTDDTCVLSTAHKAPATLSLASDSDMGYGAPLAYVGFPSGQIAVVRGHYAGQTQLRLICSVWGYYGASGSALLNGAGKVVGLLVAIDPRFPQTSYAVPVEVVRGYVVKALLAAQPVEAALQ